MPIHILKLLNRRTVANNILVFEFEKPSGFTFKPGQYAGFTLINPSETDAGGITRRFSLLNTPQDEHISFATRIQNSAYKRVLNSLPLGSEIKFAGPTGTFLLHEDSAIPAVFLAGGIGITPFYSMILQTVQEKSLRPISLFYGNQSEDDAAFLNELKELENQNINFKLITTLAKPTNSWDGETGFITPSMVKKYVSDLFLPFYYICGSPAMVTAIQEMLAEMGIDENRIMVEDFPGY